MISLKNKIFIKDFNRLLDESLKNFASGKQSLISQSLDRITGSLAESKKRLSNQDWQQLISIIRKHPIFPKIQECPFVARAFQKPRGFAGDTVIIDFLYGMGQSMEAVAKASSLGQSIYNYMRNGKAPRSVINRCEIITQELLSIFQKYDNPRVLSLACGCLRESEKIHWKGLKNLDLFLALDQDPKSLKVIDEKRYHPRLITQKIGVKQILAGEFQESGFDLIYSTGLWDYLNDHTASALTKALFSKLRSGGKLLIANFLPIEDASYMESLMDWQLIYRDKKEMRELISGIPSASIERWRIFLENKERQICFLEVVKA